MIDLCYICNDSKQAQHRMCNVLDYGFSRSTDYTTGDNSHTPCICPDPDIEVMGLFDYSPCGALEYLYVPAAVHSAGSAILRRKYSSDISSRSIPCPDLGIHTLKYVCLTCTLKCRSHCYCEARPEGQNTLCRHSRWSCIHVPVKAYMAPFEKKGPWNRGEPSRGP